MYLKCEYLVHETAPQEFERNTQSTFTHKKCAILRIVVLSWLELLLYVLKPLRGTFEYLLYSLENTVLSADVATMCVNTIMQTLLTIYAPMLLAIHQKVDVKYINAYNTISMEGTTDTTRH